MTEHAAQPTESHAEPRSGPRRPSGRDKRSRWRWSRALDQAVWTATGMFLGFALAIAAIGIYVKDLWP